MPKHRRYIKTQILKELLAKSGNECAFPECNHPLFEDNGVFVAQLCHIEAVAENGPRYNKLLNLEETNGYDNLLFLCYRHHKITDYELVYTVEKLKNIKKDHEVRFLNNKFAYSEANLAYLIEESNTYWAEIQSLQHNHIIPQLAIEIETNKKPELLFDELKNLITDLNETVEFLQKEMKTQYFETLCLTLLNIISKMSVIVDQIEIKYLEKILLDKPTNSQIKLRLEELRNQFKSIAQFGGLND